MTSPDDDDGRDGRNGQRLLSTSPAPPVMSPLTPANGYDSASQHDNPSAAATAADDDRSRDAEPADAAAMHGHSQTQTPDRQLPNAISGGDSRDTSQNAPNSRAQANMDSEVLATPDRGVTFSNAAMEMFSQPTMTHNMSLMMALAQLSASRISNNVSTPGPPPTIAPAQVSLPTPLNETGDPLAHGNGLHHGGLSAAGAPLESFARIEFADSVFQVTTYAVIIGRDQRALMQARRDERRTEDYQRRVEENVAAGLPPPSPPSQERGKFSKSYVSEEGGMLGPESDGEDNPRPAKRRKTSTGESASGHPQQQDADAEEQGITEKDNNLIINRQYVCHTPGAAAVDLTSLRPSPYHVPFIGIHSPGPGIASKTKAISREHLKIQFNQETGVFEAIPLHKNGFFCEDIHYKETKVVLRSGDRLQIKDVDFVFIINGVHPGKTGAEEYFDEEEAGNRKYSEGGKEMSFEFESSHGAEIQTTSDEEEEEVEVPLMESDSELSEIGDDDNMEVEESEVMETIEDDAEGSERKIKPEPQPELELPPPLPKKRGPGRPPKNGIMSKREERLRKKMAMELAKKTLPQPPPGEPPVKRKVGRPRKHPRPEDGTDKPDKRKYKPRKPKGGKDGLEGSDAEKAPKEKRREKPKTPPLELKKEDFTEEQLQKPNKNYGVLIDEVLTEAAGDGLTLKQIYKRIQKKYPYYFFVVDTKGWESSVRHNLIGNDAFKKNEETHLWSRVPGIELDAGKKRKAASPDQPSAALHGFGPHYSPQMPHQARYHAENMAAQGYQPTAMGPPGYQPNPTAQPAGNHNQQQANYNGQHVGVPGQQAPRPAYPIPPQAPAPAQLPGYGTPTPSLPRQLGAQTSSYSSPYAAKPPPPPTAAPNGAPAMAQQSAQPGPAANSHGGPPRQTQPSVAAGPANPSHQGGQQPVANGATAPLEPAVKPDVVSFINNFKKNVMEHLSKRTDQAEAVTLSVINRGLGLTNQSMVPDQEGIEKVVLGVFEQTRDKAYPNHVLPPGLVQVLTAFKSKWVDTLGHKLGKPKAEALLLSAIDRFLGFSERTTLRGTETEKKEYENAENMLIPQISKEVSNYQMTMAGRQ